MLDKIFSVQSSTMVVPKSNKLSTNTLSSFQEKLEKSISQQKTLSNELREQNNKDLKKDIEKLKKSVQAMKELNEQSDIKDIDNEQIVYLEEMINFLEASMLNLDQYSDSIKDHFGVELDLSELVTELKTLVENNLTLLSQGIEIPQELSLLNQKTAFLLNDIESDFSQLSVKEIRTLVSVFKDIEISNMNFTSLEKQLLTENTQTNQINLDQVEGMEVLDTPEEFEGTVTVNNKNISVDIESGSMDFDDSTPDQELAAQKLIIKDIRKSTEGSNTESIPFTLENIDGEVIINEDLGSQKAISTMVTTNSKNEITAIAQKMYSSLSSSVSRVQVEALMQNVTGKVSMILQDGGSELRMKLTPPELGQMKLSFITEDGLMRGKIIVETPEAKMFFEQNISNLRESLAHAGIELGDINIDLGSHSEFKSDDEHEGYFQAIRPNSKVTTDTEHIVKKSIIDTLVDFTA